MHDNMSNCNPLVYNIKVKRDSAEKSFLFL